MGAESSSELTRPFAELYKWPKNRVESVIKAYHEGEYDFGIDYNVIMSITGYDIEEAKELLATHQRNDTGIVNAVTLLISIIALGNGENRNEIGRAESIFDLMDFNRVSKITFDEFTILLLCLGSSFSFITDGILPKEIVQANEQKTIAYAKFVYEVLKKRTNTSITKEEFVRFFKDQYLIHGINSITEIYRRITSDPSAVEAKTEDYEDDGEGHERGRTPSPGRDGSPSRQRGKK